jgi:hypothetical protein
MLSVRLLCGASILLAAACVHEDAVGSTSDGSTGTGAGSSGSACAGMNLPPVESQDAIDVACAAWIASGMPTENEDPSASACIDALHAACNGASSPESCAGLFAASQLSCGEAAFPCVWADVATIGSAQTTCEPDDATQRCVPIRVAGQGGAIVDGCGAPPPPGDEPTVHQLYWRNFGEAGVDVVRINKAGEGDFGHVLGYSFCWSVGEVAVDGPAECDCAWEAICQ